MANVSTIVIISSVPYPELFWSWYTGLGSQTQIPKCSKVLISGVSFCQRSLSREQCFELFRTQNSQKVPGFCPWTPLGRAYSTTPDSPAAQQFFSLLHSSKNWHPQKIAGYDTVVVRNRSMNPVITKMEHFVIIVNGF